MGNRIVKTELERVSVILQPASVRLFGRRRYYSREQISNDAKHDVGIEEKQAVREP